MKKVFAIGILFFLFFSCKKENTNAIPENLLYAKVGENAGIYDQKGRFIILRGVNYNVFGDYWQGNTAVATTKQYEENDLKLMASYGVNCIRLLFSWSKLEPVSGQYNQDYIIELKKVIETAAKYDIYILLDMHQDAWGKHIVSPAAEACEKPNKGWDGAPDWATFTDGASTCTTDGSRESAPAVVHAWQNFWDNKEGIQDACVNAWKVLVKETAKYPNVVGYDLINEPSLGYKPLTEEANKLSMFYKNATNIIRTAEQEVNALEHIIFFEMTVTWNGEPLPFFPSPDFTSDENIIFAPHSYFEAISYSLTIEAGLDLLYTLTENYRTGTFLGEFGFFGDPASDVSKYKRFAAKEDANFSGSTWWQWSQAPGDPHGISWDGIQYGNTSMHMIELDKDGVFTGNVNQYYLDVLSRTRPNAIFGNPVKLISNPDDGTMELQAKANSQGITSIWIPDRFGEPVISGINILSSELKKVEGGYLADVRVNGEYTIEVGF